MKILTSQNGLMSALAIMFITLVPCSFTIATNLGGVELKTISVSKIALYPEGIDYNLKTNKFLLGSFREGAVYHVDHNGSAKVFIDDLRLNSVVGIRADSKHNKLFVTNSDIGASLRPHPKGSKKIAQVGIYNLTTGENFHFIDLGNLRPEGNHLANAIAIDKDGNAYITDSFSPIIYKIDTSGKATIFLESNRFLGKGISLNGIVYHPEGFLIVTKKDEGILFKISIDNPEQFSEVKIDKKLIGADGLSLANSSNLILIANQASGVITNKAFILTSSDNWESATTTYEYPFEDVYPTTAVMVSGKIYALHSNLNQLMSAPKGQHSQFKKTATIQQIGHYFINEK